MDRNPEIDEDRVFDTCDHFEKFGVVMFRQQRRIYEMIAEQCRGRRVLEAGCGAGIGSALIERKASFLVATDKLQKNVSFARELYPWIHFDVWDINHPTNLKAEVVVCIEALEHVTNPKAATQNLIQSAGSMLWISTPNGINRSRPPSNPNHVCEYTETEVREMIGDYEVNVLDWETSQPVLRSTDVNPLIYQVYTGDL